MSASGVCAGSRLVPAVANAAPAFAQYRPASEWFTPWALMTMELCNGAIGSITSHLRSDALFQAFGLPLRLDSEWCGPISSVGHRRIPSWKNQPPERSNYDGDRAHEARSEPTQ